MADVDDPWGGSPVCRTCRRPFWFRTTFWHDAPRTLAAVLRAWPTLERPTTGDWRDLGRVVARAREEDGLQEGRRDLASMDAGAQPIDGDVHDPCWRALGPVLRASGHLTVDNLAGDGFHQASSPASGVSSASARRQRRPRASRAATSAGPDRLS